MSCSSLTAPLLNLNLNLKRSLSPPLLLALKTTRSLRRPQLMRAQGLQLLRADQAYTALLRKIDERFPTVDAAFAAASHARGGGGGAANGVTCDDLYELLSFFQLFVEGPQLEKLFAMFDDDGGGNISYDEFALHVGALRDDTF